jgi:replication factor C large subunit
MEKNLNYNNLDSNIDSNIDSNNLNWSEKYRPKNLDDLIMSSESKNIIKSWIQDFKDKKKKCKNCLFLHGSPGLGKTTIANVILNQYDYDIIELNASEVRNQKLLKERLDKVNSNINIIDCMCMKKKHMGIIFDEIDGVSSGEKSGISEISNIIFEKGVNKNTPFICISNTLSKKIDAIKKKSIYVKINKPNKLNLKKILNKVLDKENIKVNDEIKELIVNSSNFDIRRLINLAEFLLNKNKYIDIDSITELINKFDNKTIYLTSYEATDKILNKYNNIDETLLLYEYDKTNIGMFIFENFIKFLVNNRKANNLEKLKNLSIIYDNFAESDNLDYELFIKQKYDLTNYNCILKCSETSYIINSMSKYAYNKFTKLNYSTLINKSSQEYLNSKNITNIKDKLTYFCKSDIHITICNILFKYIEKNYDNIKDILVEYNIDKDLLEKIIKFSSFYNDKTNFKAEIKSLYS